MDWYEQNEIDSYLIYCVYVSVCISTTVDWVQVKKRYYPTFLAKDRRPRSGRLK